MEDRERASVETFSRVSQKLLARPGEAHTPQSVVDLAVETVHGCDWAGITLHRGGRLQTPASTDPVVTRADDLQYDLGEGPCIDAIWADDTYLAPDLADETRWPRWVPAARDLGIASILSVRLATHELTVGGLNLYSSRPGVYDEDDVQVAHVYAAHAAAALAVSHQISTLQSALQTRHRIGVAQGILMQRFGVTIDQAFQVLRRTSQDHNIKLRDLAEDVIDARGIPPRYANGLAPDEA